MQLTSQWPRFLTILGLGTPLTVILLTLMFGGGKIDIDSPDIPGYSSFSDFNIVGILVSAFFVFWTYFMGELVLTAGTFIRSAIFRDKKLELRIEALIAKSSYALDLEYETLNKRVELFDGAGFTCFVVGIGWLFVSPGPIGILGSLVTILLSATIAIAIFRISALRIDRFNRIAATALKQGNSGL